MPSASARNIPPNGRATRSELGYSRDLGFSGETRWALWYANLRAEGLAVIPSLGRCRERVNSCGMKLAVMSLPGLIYFHEYFHGDNGAGRRPRSNTIRIFSSTHDAVNLCAGMVGHRGQ